ncbi:uncharacterized protein LOC126797249 [Argentina anserina]|uniref:uncharacterized protein LOC126797249 n=1 Tax=Argentina anserina TaxID=57926 RepID=UPI002176578A|nr:uncharacterized protein LOC126797249 [Potentilla anserina]
MRSPWLPGLWDRARWGGKGAVGEGLTAGGSSGLMGGVGGIMGGLRGLLGAGRRGGRVAEGNGFGAGDSEGGEENGELPCTTGSAGQEARSTTDAALMALSSAVGFAASQGADFLEIEGENESIFSLVTSQVPPQDAMTAELLFKCLKELDNLRRVEFCHVIPETNEAANLLARMAMETEESWFFARDAPPDIVASLDADVNGRYVPWVHPRYL